MTEIKKINDMDNKITGTTFIRKDNKLLYDKNENCIILHLEKEIPPLGYGAKQIRKMLKSFMVPLSPFKKKLPCPKEELIKLWDEWSSKTKDDSFFDFIDEYED